MIRGAVGNHTLTLLPVSHISLLLLVTSRAQLRAVTTIKIFVELDLNSAPAITVLTIDEELRLNCTSGHRLTAANSPAKKHANYCPRGFLGSC